MVDCTDIKADFLHSLIYLSFVDLLKSGVSFYGLESSGCNFLCVMPCNRKLLFGYWAEPHFMVCSFSQLIASEFLQLSFKFTVCQAILRLSFL